ncbi:MAG: type II secretion system protein [Cyanobacteria bacterium P01_G01_bin.49]
MQYFKRMEKIYQLIPKFKTRNLGTTLTENLVAMSILTITLGAMFPAFMSQKEQGINQKILAGAVTLSKETLDDLRRQPILNIPLTTETPEPIPKEKLGYSYNLTQYVCTEKPVVNADETVTCNTTISGTSNLRYILLNIEKNGNKVYTTETVFTKLR